MTDFYCDISAVGNEYRAYASNNTISSTDWGYPQDGNGKAGPGHSAAVGIATIDCASASASGAGVLQIMGQSTGALATLTGSTSTLASNIVTAINGSALATTATYSSLLLPVNRLVWARVHPTINTTVQIMMRIAGADWASLPPTTSGTWGTAPTITGFTGGADGPFAYKANNSTIFGKTLGNYGLWFAAAAGPTEPSVTTDVIHCRTKRGSNLGFSLQSSSSLGLTWKQRNYVFDDGTTWAGEDGRLTATIQNTSGSSVAFNFIFPSSGLLSFTSRKPGGFEANVSVTTTAGASLSFGHCPGVGNAKFVFSKCRFVESASNISPSIYLFTDGSSSTSGLGCDVVDSLLQCQATAKELIYYGGSTTSAWTRLNGSVFEVVAASGTIGKFIRYAGSSNVGRVEWIGGEVRDTNGVYRCPMPLNINTAIVQLEAVIDGVVGVTDAVIGIPPSAINNVRLWWNAPEGANKAFRMETPQFVADWKGDGTFPHCGALNLQGAEWAHRVTWNSAPTRQISVTPLKLSYFFRNTPATKTFDVELYVPNATTFYADELELSAAYMDSGGTWRVETLSASRGLQLAASRSAIASSGKIWTPNGVASFSAKKLSLTTTYSVKQNSEVMLRLSLCAPRAVALVFYVSPEPTVS